MPVMSISSPPVCRFPRSNRIGVLSDVTLAFASSKINVHEISARDLNDGYGVINAMVDVTERPSAG